MLIEDKNAVIYGAGGAVGGAVARAFAREGARVFLAGRTLAKLDALASQITTCTRTQLLTATAAARHMMRNSSGVILTLSATAARVTLPSDGFGVACAAVEALSRHLVR